MPRGYALALCLFCAHYLGACGSCSGNRQTVRRDAPGDGTSGVVSPGSDPFVIAITDTGFDPPTVSVTPGTSVMFRNETGAALTLVATIGGGQQLIALAAGAQSSPVALSATNATSIPHPTRSDVALHVVEPVRPTECTDPVPRPPPSSAPPPLVSPPATTCTAFVEEAPPVPAPNPTQAGDVSIVSRYQTMDRVGQPVREARFGPGTFGRQFFSGNYPTNCRSCSLLFRKPGGWPLGVAFKVELLASGLPAGTPMSDVAFWGTCRDTTPTLAAPFDPNVKFEWLLAPAPQVYLRDAPNGAGKALMRAPCPQTDANGNAIPLADQARIVAIELRAMSASRDTAAADPRTRVSINNVSLGEFSSHLARSGAYVDNPGTPIDWITRPAHLAVETGPGRAWIHTGELLVPISLFEARGAGVPAELALSYSSLASRADHSAARLPEPARFSAMPFGAGWSYTYGIRVLPVREHDPDNVVVEVLGPKGERSPFRGNPTDASWTLAGGIGWLGGADARLEKLPQGFRLWSPSSWRELRFDGEGRLTEIKDVRYTTPLSIAYQGADQIVSDSGGRVVRFTRTGDRITRVVDPRGTVWNFRYSGLSLVAIEEQAGKASWRMAYDSVTGLLKTLRDASCRDTTFRYEQARARVWGSLTSWESGGRRGTIAYDDERTVRVTDPNGGVTTWTGTAALAMFDAVATDPRGKRHTFTGQIPNIVRIDPAGNRWSATWFEGRFMGHGVGTTGVTNAWEPAASAGRKRLARVSISPNPSGEPTASVTTFRYDAGDRVTHIISPDDNPTTPTRPQRFEYDAIGRRTAAIDGAGRRTRFGYGTTAGTRNLAVTRTFENPGGESVTETFEYDGLGAVVAFTDGRGAVTRFEYDVLGRLVKRVAPGNTAIDQFAWDAAGRLVAYRDPRGFDTTWRYEDRKVTVTNPDGSTEVSTATASGALETFTNALGGVTRIHRGPAGIVDKIDGPQGELTEVEWDDIWNPEKLTRGALVYELDVDPLGRPTKVTGPDSGGVRPTLEIDQRGFSPPRSETHLSRAGQRQRVRTVHNRTGQLLEVRAHTSDADTSPSLGTLYAYDDGGLLRSVESPRAAWSGATVPAQFVRTSGSSNERSLERDGIGRITTFRDGEAGLLIGYDRSGNITKVTSAANPHAIAFEATYDARNLPLWVKGSTGRRTELAYDASGNLIWSKYADGCTRQVLFDARDRPTRVVVQSPAANGPSTLTGVDASYDASGNVTSIVGPYEVPPGTAIDALSLPPASARRQRATYDTSGRLRTVTTPHSGTTMFEYVRGL